MCCCKHASRRRRRGCLPLRRAPPDLQLHCQVVQLSLQLSHGSATSSKDGSRVIINDRRVWARMVAITLRFTGARALYRETECHFGSAERRPAQGVSAKDPSEHRPQRHMRRPIARAAPPPAGRLSHRSAIKQRQPLARPTPKAAPRDGLRITTNPLRDRDGQPQRRRPLPAAPPNKGSLSRVDARRRRPQRSPSL